ncbi:MAG: M28 family peptidase [Actinomycetota bacterium]
MSAQETPEQTLLSVVRMLAEDIGPRRPASPEEADAARRLAQTLNESGVAARLEPFHGFSTFGEHLGILTALGFAPALLPRRRRAFRAATAALAAALAATEAGQVRMPLTDLLCRRPSQNVVATIEPSEDAQRTLCLVCHTDTSRSGLLFHPSLVRHLRTWLSLNGIALAVQGAEPLLSRNRPGRLLRGLSRTILAAGLALMLERELRGQDVPGANDNASGCAVVTALATEAVAQRLESTRLVTLMTGCEEAGMLGARAFLRSRDTSGWLFLNFDNVGGDATLRYLPREGVLTGWDADPALLTLAQRIAERRPELGLEPSDNSAGLTYDTTPVLAAGGRALTLVAHDESIPNYHWPTDTVENVDPAALVRALVSGRELIAAIDRGEADRMAGLGRVDR